MGKFKKILQFFEIIILIVSILFAVLLFKELSKDIKKVLPINIYDIKRFLS